MGARAARVAGHPLRAARRPRRACNGPVWPGVSGAWSHCQASLSASARSPPTRAIAPTSTRFRERSLKRGVNPVIYWPLRAILRAVLPRLLPAASGSAASTCRAAGPLLLASNHRSFLDPFVIGTLVRRPVYYMAKRELFEKRWQAWILNALGAFPVDRGAGDGDAMATARAILERGDCVVALPRGHAHPPGPLGRPATRRRAPGARNRRARGAGRGDRHRGRAPRLADPPAQGARPRRAPAAVPDRRALLARRWPRRHRARVGVREPAVGVAGRRARPPREARRARGCARSARSPALPERASATRGRVQ